MTYCLHDMRRFPHVINLHYFDNLDNAEILAVDMMDELGFAWASDRLSGHICYTQRGAKWVGPIYIRILERVSDCRICGKRATKDIRSGRYCDEHYSQLE